jgi:Protein of unknown function (DUF2716)
MPWRDADDAGAWNDLSRDEYDDVWTRVYTTLDFKPTNRGRWPSFREPTGSVAWSLEPVLASAASDIDFELAECSVATYLLAALVSAKGADHDVYALDWQHPCFRFNPSLARPPARIDSWLVPALPNGDYYLFLARDLRFGWLSNPWECSVCVYGDLLPDLSQAAVQFGWPVLRQN